MHFIYSGDRFLNNFLFALTNKGLTEICFIIEILLKIFFCTTSTNCAAERLFSILKKLQNYLRNPKIEEKLNHTLILVINSNITLVLDYFDIIIFCLSRVFK